MLKSSFTDARFIYGKNNLLPLGKVSSIQSGLFAFSKNSEGKK